MRKSKIVILEILGGLLILCIAASIFCFCSSKNQKKDVPDIAGMKDFTIETGEDLPDLTKGITKTEDVDTVSVDVTGVNINLPGAYPVIYSFTDRLGNTYTRKITCTVIDSSATELPAKLPATEATVTESAVTEMEVTEQAESTEE